jgi:hypothetical protein
MGIFEEIEEDENNLDEDLSIQDSLVYVEASEI